MKDLKDMLSSFDERLCKISSFLNENQTKIPQELLSKLKDNHKHIEDLVAMIRELSEEEGKDEP